MENVGSIWQFCGIHTKIKIRATAVITFMVRK